MEKISEICSLQIERIKLRERNNQARNQNENEGKKSSELKKVQRFINKLKQNDLKTRDSLFICEISAIIAETTIQQKDLLFFMNFCSILHQTYEDFSSNLFTDLQKQIKSGGGLTDDIAKANKRRNLFRFLCELFLIGFPYQFSKIVALLQEIIMSQDKDVFNYNITTGSAFAFYYHYEFFDIPFEVQPSVEFFKELIKPEGKKALLEIYRKYGENLKESLKYIYNKMLEQETKNNSIIIEKGLIDIENETKYKELKSLYQKTIENINIISESLHLEISTNISDETTRMNTTVPQKSEKEEENKENQDKSEDLFTNDEDKYFYTDLIDLKDSIPEILLLPIKKIDKLDKIEKIDKTIGNIEENETQIKANQKVEGNIDIPLNYDQFLKKLNQCISKDVADELAKDFCYINNKKNKNRLISDIIEYRYEYTLMTPFFCRFIAILSKYFKDIGEGLVQKLVDDFKILKENTRDSFKDLEKRVRNMKFICELTKFRICSTLIMLNCLKEYIDDFTGHNIEMAILILESCGPFLLRNKDSAYRFTHMLNQIEKLRKAKMMPPNIDMQIENALMTVKPSSKPAQKIKKVGTDLEEYIKYLFFEKLNADTLDIVAQKLLKLPWKECEDFVVKQIIKRGIKGRFDNIDYLAFLLAFLKDKYPFVVIKVTDYVIEHIFIGLEFNNFNERQQRISFIKFFGELYCYEIIDQDLVFEILYQLLEYSHENIQKQEKIDPKDDTFRVTLACTLLESVKEYFKSNKMKSKVERYLTFLQRYIHSKTYLPMLLEFMVLDIFEYLAPNMPICKNLKEAEDNCILFGKNTPIFEQEPKTKEIYDEENKKLDEMRKETIKDYQKDFETEFQQIISESINETKNANINPMKINAINIIKKKPKQEEEKNIINLISRQGNKIISKEIGLSTNNKILSIIQKKKDIEASEKNELKNITSEMHKQSVQNISEPTNYQDYLGNDQIL